MKINFVCFKLSKTVAILVLIILLQLIFIAIGIKEIRETRNFEQIKSDVEKISKTSNNIKENCLIESINEIQIEENVVQNIQKQSIANDIQESKDFNTIKIQDEATSKGLEEYKDMPKKLNEYKVIGKIEIPKLKLNSYILSETNKKSLKVSITKLYGPDINKVGNFCIAGHNYKNDKMFGGIKKLELGDKIVLTDTFGRSINYNVYENYQTDPKNVECLNQDTQRRTRSNINYMYHAEQLKE